MAGELDQLLPCSWRDIQFPTTSVEVSFQQDLAEHRYYGVDGANVEATGRGPMNITVNIPMVNGIVPGKNENWGVLYPTVFRALLRAAADRTIGLFIHPELDQIPAKVRSVDFKHDGQMRDGVAMVVSFVECPTAASDEVAVGDSPVSAAELGALDLDASDADLRALVPDAPELEFSVEDFIDSLTAISDQFSLQSKRAYGVIDRYAYHLRRTEESVVRARNAATWPVLDAVNKAKSAINWVREHPFEGRSILRHRVNGDVSLAALLNEIPGATLGDIVKLNPRIMAAPIVRSGTFVRYFAPR